MHSPIRRRARLPRMPLLAVVALLLAACGPSTAPVGDEGVAPAFGLPRLKTSGNALVSEAGNPVVLRGANVLRDEWAGGDMTFVRAAIEHLATDWNGTLVTHGFASGPVNDGDASYLARLDEYVALTARHGMYLNLCYYYPTENGYQPDMPDGEAERAMAFLAARYKDESHLIFQLQAEPDQHWPRASEQWWHDTLLPRFNSMVTAIRSASAPHRPVILVPGVNYGRYLRYAVNPDNRITADGAVNIVYTTHSYDPAGTLTQPSAEVRENFLDVHDVGLPVLVTEFGTGTQMNQADTETLMTLLRERGISWTAWVFDSEGPPVLLSSRSTMAVSVPYGEAVRAEMRATPPLPAQ